MNSTQIFFLIIFTVGPCLLVAFYLGYVLLFRLQIHIVELMVTMLVSTLPLGVILTHLHSNYLLYDPEEWAKAAAVGSFPMIFIFAGSVWGMSAIKRLEIARPWRRIGVLAAGWGLVFFLLSPLPLLFYALIRSISSREEDLSNEFYVCLILFSGALLSGIPGLILEWKCRTLARERKKLQLREQLKVEREARQNKNA